MARAASANANAFMATSNCAPPPTSQDGQLRQYPISATSLWLSNLLRGFIQRSPVERTFCAADENGNRFPRRPCFPGYAAGPLDRGVWRADGDLCNETTPVAGARRRSRDRFKRF